MCRPTIHYMDKCHIYKKINTFYDIYNGKINSKRDGDIDILNYRIKYIFENFQKCHNLRSIFGDFSDETFFLLEKLYCLGGFSKRNEAIIIAMKKDNRKIFDSIVLGNKHKINICSSVLKTIAKKPYYLYNLTRSGVKINDELLKTLFIEYRQAVIHDLDKSIWDKDSLSDLSIESAVYFEKNYLFELNDLYGLIIRNKYNTMVLIKANYNFTFQFTDLMSRLISENNTVNIETLVYHMKPQLDYMRGYVMIYKYIKKKYFEIKKSLRRFVNKNYRMTNDKNIKLIKCLFKSVHSNHFIDDNREVFIKIIKNKILPKYDRYFSKILFLKKLLKRTNTYLDEYSGTKAIIEHDLSKIISKDMAHNILSFY